MAGAPVWKIEIGKGCIKSKDVIGLNLHFFQKKREKLKKKKEEGHLEIRFASVGRKKHASRRR